MNPPGDFSFTNWLLEHLWAPALGLIGVIWKQNQSAMSAMERKNSDAMDAHAKEDEKQFQSVHDELVTQRGHIAKLFDQMRDEAQRSEARHRELMTQSHASQTALLTALNAKADK